MNIFHKSLWNEWNSTCVTETLQNKIPKKLKFLIEGSCPVSRMICENLWEIFVLEKKIDKFCWCIFTIHYFEIVSPWNKVGHFIWKRTWIPLTQRWFVPSLVEIGTVVQEKKMKIEKLMTRTTTRMTNNGNILIRKAHLSLWLRWARNNSDTVVL